MITSDKIKPLRSPRSFVAIEIAQGKGPVGEQLFLDDFNELDCQTVLVNGVRQLLVTSAKCLSYVDTVELGDGEANPQEYGHAGFPAETLVRNIGVWGVSSGERGVMA